MDRKIFLYLLLAVALGFIGIMMMTPQERKDSVVRLPWLVSVDAQGGRSRVFGFTIGETTLADIRKVFSEEGEINLFSRADRQDSYVAEAYFERIYLSGLRGDFVITIGADQPTLEAMYQRGLRISELGSGSKKVKLAPADIETLAEIPVSAITYLPWKSLDAEIVEERFGKPSRTLTEESGVIHWLYAEKGMDVALDKDGGAVIQYVNPGDFANLIAPLEQAR
jgi:hypothetical protein